LQSLRNYFQFAADFTRPFIREYRFPSNKDRTFAATWNAALRDNGIFKSPGKLYPSLVLTQADLDQTEQAFGVAAQTLAHHRA
jgi:glutamate-1-semialdehyde 2,1-aminomutase